MPAESGIDDLGSERVERGERPFLVRAHEAAVADHIGGQDRGQFACGSGVDAVCVHTSFIHAGLPRLRALARTGAAPAFGTDFATDASPP